MSNRRHFLRSVVLVGAALSVRPIASLAGTVMTGAGLGGRAPAAGSAEPLSHGAFTAARGTPFRLADGTELVLDTVSPIQRGPCTESFSLWLRNDDGAKFSAGTHRFDHGTMGRFEMFVVPKATLNGEAGCEAVFNHLVA